MWESEGWTFSPELKERIDAVIEKYSNDVCLNSERSKNWLYLQNYSREPVEDEINKSILSGKTDSAIDIETTVQSTVESLENNCNLPESDLISIQKKYLNSIFNGVYTILSEAGFHNLCRTLTKWENNELLNISFSCIILTKLKEREEATLSTINAIVELAKSKPSHVSQVMISLLTDEAREFLDEELLEKVFVVLPETDKEIVTMSILRMEAFRESSWKLIQVISLHAPKNAYDEIIKFMKSRCKNYANSQTFTRLLIHLCKNLESDSHKDAFFYIANNIQTLLKHQALKLLAEV